MNVAGSRASFDGHRDVAIVGAASSVGIRPYEEGGRERELHRAPAELRRLGLAGLASVDLGDVRPPPYRDFVRPADGVRNEAELLRYLPALALRVEEALSGGSRVLVLGGDCSIVLGSLLGATAGGRQVGLVYIDAHADFATPSESATGSAASMCLAMAVGRGDSALARLREGGPLVAAGDVALVGRRDQDDPYGREAVASWGILDLPLGQPHRADHGNVVPAILERVARPELDGYWIHLDADVIDPAVMPAVDSPEPGGPGIDEVVRLLTPLLAHPRALGLQVTIYDPALDPDRGAGKSLVVLLMRAFGAAVPVGVAGG